MKGIGISSGIAIGRAFVIKTGEYKMTGVTLNNDAGAFKEIAKFDKAVEKSIKELEFILLNKDLDLQEKEIAILESQIEFLGDPQIRIDVLDKIQNGNNTAHDSLILMIHRLVQTLQHMENEQMIARSADVQDIGKRLLKHLNSSFNPAATVLQKDTIIITEDISPSDMISMDLTKVIGFATRLGCKTSHTATLAKAKGIPAVVGCGKRLNLIKNNDIIILDGKSGHVIINPDKPSLDEYIRLRTEHHRMTEALKSLLDETD